MRCLRCNELDPMRVCTRCKWILAERVIEAAREVYEHDDFITEGVDEDKTARDQELGRALLELDSYRGR